MTTVMDDRSGRPGSTRGPAATGPAATGPASATGPAFATGLAADPAEGLSGAEAAERLARYGPNELPTARGPSVWRLIARQLRDPLISVLLVAAALTIATGDWTDAGIILLVVVVNTAVGVTQEVKADQAIAALSRLTAPEARVVRGGRQEAVPAADVVTGDILVLAEGDIVPADADVLEAAALLVDESALTGESVPVEKTVGGQDNGVPAGPGASGLTGACGSAGVSAGTEISAETVLSAGTTVLRGHGRAVVTATGADSAMGRVAALMGEPRGLTPLQRKLAGLGRVLALAAVALCAIVMVVGLARGQDAELMVVTAISLVVAAVPESLPAVVTLALALGARRMSARNALIRRLPAVETLGSVTVLGTDKTGTLTEGTMVARRLWTPHAGEALVSGEGYGPDGEVTRVGAAVRGPAVRGPAVRGPAVCDEDLVALVTAGALCNDAALRAPEDGGEWAAVGDPTEAALLAAAARFGLDPSELQARFPRVAEVPFDSVRKRMTTVHRLPSGGVRVIGKGAPEVMLATDAADPEILARAAKRAHELAGGGHRVLAVAAADLPDLPDTETMDSVSPDSLSPGSVSLDRASLEGGLRLLGLIAIVDPPRRSAAATIASAQAAGMTPVLITGDHPATAAAIARELGIIGPGEETVDCRSGDSDVGGAGTYGEGRVYARATPEQKLSIIAARQAGGDVVAMTGDGVNDGPALRRADIGVALGGRGTEVARQASDMVLADDDLGTVVAAAEEGRRVYANIRRFLLYGLSGGAAEIAVMLIGPLAGLALPLLPAQILWVNLLTHGLPGVALGSEPPEEGAMRRPPRPPAESVLGAGLWQRIVRVGLVITAVTLGVALWGHATGRPWQPMAFYALGTTQLAVALGSRARPGTLANPALLWAVAGAFGLQLAGVYLPFLNDMLRTRPLAWPDLLAVTALSAAGYFAIRLDRLLHADSSAEGR